MIYSFSMCNKVVVWNVHRWNNRRGCRDGVRRTDDFRRNDEKGFLLRQFNKPRHSM